VRDLARAAGLPVADKRESQDLCFLAGIGGRAFLHRHGDMHDRRGAIVTEQGDPMGGHDGQHNFTVGQRRGLGVGSPEPLYVLDKDAARNRVVVGPRTALAISRVKLSDVRLHRDRVQAVKLRYRSAPVACRVASRKEAALELDLEEPVHGVAPGQTACLLSGDRVVGAGTIERASG
jgi:tRNA-uridine 2-sulfurtransferase